MTFLEAMARMEGFSRKGSRPQRNNNPLDIEYGAFARAHGATCPEKLPDGRPGRFALFPSAEDGFNAARALLRGPKYAGLTVAEVITKWAPPTENDTEAYIRSVCNWTGCKPADPVGPLLESGSV